MIKNICLLIVVLPLIYPSRSSAQSQLTLYHFGGNLPQSNMLNPGIIPNYKVAIGLPVISGIQFGFSNSAIAFRDIFYQSDNGKLQLDTARLPDKVKKQHHTLFGAELQLFYFGIRAKRSYFSLGLHTVAKGRIAFPGTIVSWVLRGPEDKRVQDKHFSLQDVKLKFMAYHQLSLGYAYNITERLSAGIRLKYLMGIAGVDLLRTNGTVHLSQEKVSATTERMRLNISELGYAIIQNPELALDTKALPNTLFNLNNMGMAVDLGARYRLNDRWTFSASVADIGFINWQGDNLSYEIRDGNYSFSGTDLINIAENELGISKIGEKEIEKVKKEFELQKKTGEAFTSNLTGKAYLGASCRVYRSHTVRTALYFDIFKGGINPAVSLAYNVPVGNVLNGVIGVSYKNGQIDNVGIGLSIKLGPVQLYAASDRLNPVYYPARISQTNLQTGINLVFSGRKKKKKEEKEPEKEPEEEIKPEKEEIEPKKDTVTVELPAKSIPSLVSTYKLAQNAPQPLVIKPGKGKNISIDYYVVVGAFEVESNAIQYSKELKANGYTNQIDLLPPKNLYYVYTYKTTNEILTALAELEKIRKTDKFMFPETWIFRVVRVEEGTR